MYNGSEGIKNAHFKPSPAIAQDGIPCRRICAMGAERAHQYGSSRDLSLRLFLVHAHTGYMFKIPCISVFVVY